jgi:hypothetical protein
MNLKLSTSSVYDDLEEIERKTRVFQILNSLNKYNNLNERLQKTVEFVVKYFNAYFARIWFIDKTRSNLILKFSAGKYTVLMASFLKYLSMIHYS